MSKPALTTRRERDAARFKLLHDQLRREIKAESEPEDKRTRKAANSAAFRAGQS